MEISDERRRYNEAVYQGYLRRAYDAMEYLVMEHLADLTPLDVAYDLLSEKARRMWSKYSKYPNMPEFDFKKKENRGTALRLLRFHCGRAQISRNDLARTLGVYKRKIEKMEDDEYARELTVNEIYWYLEGLERAIEEWLRKRDERGKTEYRQSDGIV